MSRWLHGCITLTVIFMCTMAVVPAAVAQSTYQFNLPEQALADSLRAIGQQTELNILFEPEAVKGVLSPALRGAYTADEAIHFVLNGTKLEAQHTATNNVVIKPRSTTGNTSRANSQPASEYQQNANVPSAANRNAAEFEEPKLDEIIVTGTHIHGASNPTAPLIVIDRAEIERSGYVTTEQLVASIPQNFGGGPAGATADGPVGSGGLAAFNHGFGTGINLRGLGTSSTLVLVNGHRLAPSADGIFVDVSTIPLAAVDRVEIMTDGASAIYGTDAVAGVVNFILRKDYQGRETWATYGSGTDGTHSQSVIGQSLGQNWTGGNAVGTLQYQRLGALPAADRSYTVSASSPYATDLLPKSESYSALYNVRQDLGSGFDIASDGMYSRSDGSGLGNGIFYQQSSSFVTDSGVATIDLDYRPTEQWRIDASGSYTKVHTAAAALHPGNVFDTHDTFNIWSVDLIADGTLFHSPGGDAKMAVGGSYRNETQNLIQLGTFSGANSFGRHVSAEFAELALPVVGTKNALTGVKQFDVSLAVRRDDYSDFGATTNPRYGLSWQPIGALHIRAAYSTSFRTANAYEENASLIAPFIIESNYPSPSPSGGDQHVFVQYYTRKQLQPEKSRNVTTGIDFEPVSVPNFKASVNYFNIRYKDRIITPNFDSLALSEPNVYGSLITPIPNDAAALAYIAQTLSQGGQFYNQLDGFSTNYTPGVGYLLNQSLQNAALVRTNGVDLALNYHVSFDGNDFLVGLNATRINQILTSYTATTMATDLVNTYNNPLHWRARGQFGWSSGPWSVNSAVNYSGRYTDNTSAPIAPIASWTTVDAQLAYAPSFAKNTSLSLSCTNLLNRDPPYVGGLNNSFSGIHYDVGNGNPLGRVVVLSVRVGW
jgi:iron complex outermembrane receptor protein